MRYQSIPQLDATGLVRTSCTELGEGPWSYGETGMEESFEALACELVTDPRKMVRVNQKHTANVHVATIEDGGRGIYRPHIASHGDCNDDLYEDFRIADGIDGLVTNVPGLTLCTTEADCVPVFLLDPVNRAIGMVHSGWRGTAARISLRAIDLMTESFGTDPASLQAALGPCICKECYEVGGELKDCFGKYFTSEQVDAFFEPRGGGKFLLDVPRAVEETLLEAGIAPENITMPLACTSHSGMFASYRRDHLPHDRMLTAIVLR